MSGDPVTEVRAFARDQVSPYRGDFNTPDLATAQGYGSVANAAKSIFLALSVLVSIPHANIPDVLEPTHDLLVKVKKLQNNPAFNVMRTVAALVQVVLDELRDHPEWE